MSDLIQFKNTLYMLLGLNKDSKLVIVKVRGKTVWTYSYTPKRRVLDSLTHVSETGGYEGYSQEIGFIRFWFNRLLTGRQIIGHEYVADVK